MTNPQEQTASSEQPDVDELPVVDVREKRTVRERLGDRTCEWCGEWMPYDGRGRPPVYCTDAHRQRAYEVRTAQARQERDAAAGKVRTEPVREVVERVETVTRTVVRQGPPEIRRVPATRASGQPFTLPETPQEWADTIRYLAGDANSGRFAPHLAMQLAQVCEMAAQALRTAAAGPLPPSPAGTAAPVPPPRRERRAAAKKRRKKGR